jgi:rare lipoprotein A (peptidoglycan hydrolase)
MFAKTLIAAAFAALAVAAPARLEKKAEVDGSVKTSVATWYDLDSYEENDGYPNQVFCNSDAYHNDSPIAAIKGGKNHCGDWVVVTNQKTRKSVEVQILDECASCSHDNQIDLPKAVWEELNQGVSSGMLDIEWHFTNKQE